MSVIVEIDHSTHLVIKKAHLDALNERERVAFSNLTDKIHAKYGNDRTYTVCNIDEFYYPDVMKIILDGEARKLMDKKLNEEYPDKNKLGPKREQGT